MSTMYALLLFAIGFWSGGQEVYRELRSLRRHQQLLAQTTSPRLRRQLRLQRRAEQAVRWQTQAHNLTVWLGIGGKLVFHPDHLPRR